MNGIRAVGFDLDGTFMNTRVDYVRLNSTDRTVCISHGVPFDEIDFGDSPKRLREPIRRWMEDNGRGSEYPELSREIDDALTECECEFADETTPFPGSVECLGRLRDMGYRTGLLTRGSLAYAKRVLGPVFDEFDAVMGRDHSCYDNAKPSPVAMVEFAELLGVRPDEILYVGDNSTDWMSAHGAGARFVGVRTGSGSDAMWASIDPSIPVIDHAGDVVDLL